MSDLIDDDGPPGGDTGRATGGNAPEFTVSEISGAVKRAIEGGFGRVRVRGEVGRVVLARTGHLYFDLKDERNVLAAVSWKGQVARLHHRPEEGMEVIASGRLTTFGPQSKYQLNVEDVEPAGAGALMAMLENRRRALAAEGLFDTARKRAVPFLPEVIGVVTSPTGAVIRDILHRLRDRFPRRVLIWPVAVQGAACAPEVARAIAGFNRLPEGGPVPRPDLLIVARGGGSIEDLWGFNEEIVVRAAAASRIPLISAVGHETDTTLIDHAADRRAPTPTAAAEMAVPVRIELIARVGDQGARLSRALAVAIEGRRQRLRDLSRALPRPERLTETARQRLDRADLRLEAALRLAVQSGRLRLAEAAAHLRPGLPGQRLAEARRLLADRAGRLRSAAERARRQKGEALAALAARLRPAALGREAAGARSSLSRLAERLDAAFRSGLAERAARLAALERVRQSVGYVETLRRGYAVVRGDGGVVTSAARAAVAAVLEIEFRDGRLAATPAGSAPPPAPPAVPSPAGPRRDRKPPEGQGTLF